MSFFMKLFGMGEEGAHHEQSETAGSSQKLDLQ